MLERELNRRKEVFSEYNGSYYDYINKSEKKIPTIFVILNGWELFNENYNI